MQEGNKWSSKLKTSNQLRKAIARTAEESEMSPEQNHDKPVTRTTEKGGENMVIKALKAEDATDKLRSDKERFIELRAQGWSYERIAKDLGRGKQTVFNWKHELEEEIQNAKALYLATLREEYWLTKQAKIELFGEILKRLHDELKGRDMSTIPTEKLLELLNKYYAHMEQETGPETTYSEKGLEAAKFRRQLEEGF